MGTEKKGRKAQKNMENQGKTWKNTGKPGKTLENQGKTQGKRKKHRKHEKTGRI